MKVIYGEDVKEMFGSKYIVLELDTFLVEGEELAAHAVIAAEDIALGDLADLQHWCEFHDKMINGYKTQQWNFVMDCASNLRGKFGGEIDSFYEIMKERCAEFDKNGIPDGWEPTITK